MKKIIKKLKYITWIDVMVWTIIAFGSFILILQGLHFMGIFKGY